MNRLNYSILFGVGIFLISCQAPKPDFTEIELQKSNSSISAPLAEYFGPAWLDDNRIAFSYRELGPENYLSDHYIAYAELDTDAWHNIELPPEPAECIAAARVVKGLKRLPNGNLGYTYDCRNNGISGIVYAWDKANQEIIQLHRYSVPFAVGPYSFAPDMTAYLQVGENGLSQELHRVTLGNPTTVKRIFSNFKRVRAPAWSPDGETIAFVGTESVEESSGWQDLVSLPWDLYLMDANGSNVRILFPKIGNPYNMRWSPDGQWLFFAGSRRPVGSDGGIWMLNVESLEIFRIWSYNTFFDLSPDGDKIVIIEEERVDDEVVRTHPAIYKLPDM